MTPDCYKEAVVDQKSRGLRYLSFIPPSSQPLGAHFAVNAQSVAILRMWCIAVLYEKGLSYCFAGDAMARVHFLC